MSSSSETARQMMRNVIFRIQRNSSAHESRYSNDKAQRGSHAGLGDQERVNLVKRFNDREDELPKIRQRLSMGRRRRHPKVVAGKPVYRLILDERTTAKMDLSRC